MPSLADHLFLVEEGYDADFESSESAIDVPEYNEPTAGTGQTKVDPRRSRESRKNSYPTKPDENASNGVEVLKDVPDQITVQQKRKTEEDAPKALSTSRLDLPEEPIATILEVVRATTPLHLFNLPNVFLKRIVSYLHGTELTTFSYIPAGAGDQSRASCGYNNMFTITLH